MTPILALVIAFMVTQYAKYEHANNRETLMWYAVVLVGSYIAATLVLSMAGGVFVYEGAPDTHM